MIHNWVDTQLHRPEAGATENRFRRELGLEDRFTVLFAGVMGYAQDMETIVEAAARLREESRIVFLLVGDGSERAGVERRIGELKLANVRRLPFVSREEYPALVAACDAGLVTLKKTMKTPVVPSKLPTYMASARRRLRPARPAGRPGSDGRGDSPIAQRPRPRRCPGRQRTPLRRRAPLPRRLRASNRKAAC